MFDLVPQAPRSIPSREIARRLFGATPTEAQRRSMRRAVRSLAGKGLVIAELRTEPTLVRNVTGYARPGGSGYRKVDRGGHRLGHAMMNTLSRPAADGPQDATHGPEGT